MPDKMIIADGITAEVDGDELILRVDLTNDAGKTSSGNDMIAKTPGAAIPGLKGIKVGLNVYRVKPKG